MFTLTFANGWGVDVFMKEVGIFGGDYAKVFAADYDAKNCDHTYLLPGFMIDSPEKLVEWLAKVAARRAPA